MSAKLHFFPVGNGDMTLLVTEEGKRILIDCHIRNGADDEEDKDMPDVGSMLRDLLERDEQNRLYVDAFLLTHPDQDHCGGLRNHFLLSPLSAWSEKDDLIVIREMWSSPIIFRRKEKAEELTLSEDALAWWAEARRRVQCYRDAGDRSSVAEGNGILILGEDVHDKTEGLDEIRVPCDATFNVVNGAVDSSLSIRLLGPLPPQDDEEVEDCLEKNRSSVIAQFRIAAGGKEDACLFLTGGDAGFFIWKKLWEDHYSEEPEALAYDLLKAPHHCSLHSLSADSWSEMGEEIVIDADARNALGQAREDAFIISSSKPVTDDDSDPPCIRAKREYESILTGVDGEFICAMDDEGESKVLTFDITDEGPDATDKSAPSSTPPNFGITPPSTPFAKPSGGSRYA